MLKTNLQMMRENKDKKDAAAMRGIQVFGMLSNACCGILVLCTFEAGASKIHLFCVHLEAFFPFIQVQTLQLSWTQLR